jgi:hypothetical protein
MARQTEADRYSASLQNQDAQIRELQTKAEELAGMLHHSNERADRHAMMVADLEQKAHTSDQRARLLEAGLNGLRQQADDVVRTGSIGPTPGNSTAATDATANSYTHANQQYQHGSAGFSYTAPSPIRPALRTSSVHSGVNGSGWSDAYSVIPPGSPLSHHRAAGPTQQQQAQQQQHQMQQQQQVHQMYAPLSHGQCGTGADDGGRSAAGIGAGGGNDGTGKDEQRAMVALSASLHKLFNTLGEGAVTTTTVSCSLCDRIVAARGYTSHPRMLLG